MGRVLGALTEGAGDIQISLLGKAFQHGEGFVTNAILCGLIGESTDRSVNLINAVDTSKSLGWTHETNCGPAEGQFSSEIKVVVTAGSRTHKCTGVVFGDEPRLVELDGARVEATLDGSLFIMENADMPGVVGAVGSALAAANVNVNRVHLAKAHGNKAVSIWSVSHLDDALLQSLSQLNHVQRVTPVSLTDSAS